MRIKTPLLIAALTLRKRGAIPVAPAAMPANPAPAPRKRSQKETL
jgi:hypothetical protein